MTEEQKRMAVVTEARSWIGTPYRVRGRVKGAGCDCGSFLLQVAVNCGLMTDEELGVYSLDSWAHWPDEKYQMMILRHATCVSMKSVPSLDGIIAYKSTKGLRAGMVVLSRPSYSKRFNHGGFVTNWPMIIHTAKPGVEEIDATKHNLWAYRPIAVFDFEKIAEGTT